MKLKIKAYTNQNVSIGVFDYPPYSELECEIDSKHLPTYAKAFDSWEIIEPEKIILKETEYKVEPVVENKDDKQNTEQGKEQPKGQGPKKVATKQSKH
jgi:hypothetical protein